MFSAYCVCVYLCVRCNVVCVCMYVCVSRTHDDIITISSEDDVIMGAWCVRVHIICVCVCVCVYVCVVQEVGGSTKPRGGLV